MTSPAPCCERHCQGNPHLKAAAPLALGLEHHHVVWTSSMSGCAHVYVYVSLRTSMSNWLFTPPEVAFGLHCLWLG